MTKALSTLICGFLLTLATNCFAPIAAAQSQPSDEANPASSAKVLDQGGAERQANYYYPSPQSHEVYESQATILSDSDRDRRIGFVIGLTQQMLSNPYPPTFAIFAKGDDAERLIVVSLVDGRYNTLYRARALFATLTAVARTTPFFRDNAIDDLFNFFDLCKLLGFKEIIWSDGKELAHQIVLK
ncbi:MAG TPA: molybdopterin-guanine dinucleotide biosynthesis protein A [Alphaproteobacteria bacterium]